MKIKEKEMKKLESLSKKQEARLDEFRDKWLELGLSTKPADHPKAEDAIRRAYQVAGHQPPEFIIWMKNPCDAVLAHALILEWVSIGVVQKKIMLEGAQVRDQVSDQVSAQVRDQVRAQVSDQVSAQVSAQVRDQVRDQVSDQINPMFIRVPSWYYGGLGNQDWWLGWLDFFGEVVGLSVEKVQPLIDLAYYGHWYWAMAGVVIMCDRPTSIKRDGRGRLHNDEGPAVEYDGFRLYAMDGVRLPDWIVEHKEEINPDNIDAEANGEIRRIMMRLYGWERYLKVKKAKLLDRDSDPTIGELWSFKDKDGVEIKILKARNGTKEVDGYRNFSMWVDPINNTALQANRWTYPSCRGLSDEDYRILNSARA